MLHFSLQRQLNFGFKEEACKTTMNGSLKDRITQKYNIHLLGRNVKVSNISHKAEKKKEHMS